MTELEKLNAKEKKHFPRKFTSNWVRISYILRRKDAIWSAELRKRSRRINLIQKISFRQEKISHSACFNPTFTRSFIRFQLSSNKIAHIKLNMYGNKRTHYMRRRRYQINDN